jgi:hypothetical protein
MRPDRVSHLQFASMRPAGVRPLPDFLRGPMAANVCLNPEARMPRPAELRAGSHIKPKAGNRSAPQSEASDQFFIARLIFALEIIQQAPPLTNHHQQATTRVEILFVFL